MNRYIGSLGTDVYGINADEARLAHITISAEEAVAADPDGLVDGYALGEEASIVTEFLNPMPYPRNITIVASAAQDGKVTVIGTNIADEAISEEITINGDTPVVGTKAFKTVTSIELPAKDGSETVDIGWGDKLGMPYMFNKKTLVMALLDGVIETTAATQAIDDDEIEKNTVDLSSALNGKVIDLYFAI
jgi:hypothetical protein